MVEVLVALGLIAVSLMMILGLIPAGVQSSQRASDVQAAAAWSRQLLEETPAPTEFPIIAELASKAFEAQIGPTKFFATRTVQVAGPYLYRIEVTTTYHERAQPVRLSLTRFNPAGPES